MICTNMIVSDDHSKSKKTDLLSYLHRTACMYGTLFVIFCLSRCYLSFANALQDVHKFEHTDTFTYLLYYLGEYQFLETVCSFLLVMTELLFYVAQYRRITQGKPLRGGIGYFFVMLVIHTAICLHANSLPLPDFGPSSVAEEAGMHYRFFANVTVSPSIIYFVLYLLRLRKSGAKTDV